jgi:hypothetical protein
MGGADCPGRPSYLGLPFWHPFWHRTTIIKPALAFLFLNVHRMLEERLARQPYAKPLLRSISTQSPLNSPLDIKRTCADIGKKREMQDTSQGSRLISREKAEAEQLLKICAFNMYNP